MSEVDPARDASVEPADAWDVAFMCVLATSGEEKTIRMRAESKKEAEEIADLSRENAALYMSGWFGFGPYIIRPSELAYFCFKAIPCDEDI